MVVGGDEQGWVMHVRQSRTGSRETSEERAATRTQELAIGDIVVWRGRPLQIKDLAPLSPGHVQATLEYLDRRQLPVSVPVDDLRDADIYGFRGRYQPRRDDHSE